MSQPYAAPQSPPPTGGGGTSVILIILGVVAVLGIGCLGICGFGVFRFTQEVEKFGEKFGTIMLTSMVHEQAKYALQQNAEVKAKFGEPLSFGEPTQQEVDLNENTGSAKFDFAISGPNGQATAHAEGSTQDEEFKLTVLRVTMADGSVINIDPTSVNFDNMQFNEDAMAEEFEEAFQPNVAPLEPAPGNP